MDQYEKAANTVLNTCMAALPDETVLIITDPEKKTIADIFLATAEKNNITTKEIVIPLGQANGEEPPNEATEAMLKHKVQLLITDKSLSHTAARKNACKQGARIASMPGITKDMLGRCVDIDYKELKKKDDEIQKILNEGKVAKITSSLGTNLTMNIEGREAFPDDGIYNTPGAFGNLPSGEVAIAPLEGSSNGIYVIDACFAGIPNLQSPLKITIKDGISTNIEGKNAEELKSMLKKEEYGNLAEFGIGTNPKAKITGITLEDEKVLGTIHLALGNSLSFGGKVDVPLHVDGVMKNPTVMIDDKKILENGKLLIP